MTDTIIISIIMTIIGASTPILLAALGELVVEKSGVLNLGIEGMMLIGAVTGFAVTSITGFPLLGIFAAMITATLSSLLFGYLTLSLTANQVAYRHSWVKVMWEKQLRFLDLGSQPRSLNILIYA
jgi:ABC-type uncharacterized transport system permease subunit